MRMTVRRARRGAALTVELAIVLPVFLFILLGILVGASGVFAAEEVAMLSREGTRFASVRGTRYAEATARPPATDADVINYVKSRMCMLDPNLVECYVAWSPDKRPGSYVTVEVRYKWTMIDMFGSWQLKNRATMQVYY